MLGYLTKILKFIELQKFNYQTYNKKYLTFNTNSYETRNFCRNFVQTPYRDENYQLNRWAAYNFNTSRIDKPHIIIENNPRIAYRPSKG